MDNPAIRRGLDKLTTSLNQIGDSFEKAFEVKATSFIVSLPCQFHASFTPFVGSWCCRPNNKNSEDHR